MLHDDLKWENSFDNFCLENNIQGEKKIQLIAIYGRAVFDVISSRIYHDFIKNSLWNFHQDVEVDLPTLSTYIHNLYHEDLFLDPPKGDNDIISIEELLTFDTFAFKAIGDGEKISKLSFASHKSDLQEALQDKKNIVCMFKVPDNLKSLQETILARLHKDTKLYLAIEHKVPSSFHIDWENQEKNIYKVINSPFIR